MKKESGFIHIIILVIIFVAIALYFGKNPVAIWENSKPLFVKILMFFVDAIDFLIRIITRTWQNS